MMESIKRWITKHPNVKTKHLLNKFRSVPDSKAVLFKAALRAVATCTDGRWNLNGSG